MPEFLRRFLSPDAQGGAAAVLEAPAEPKPEIKPVAGNDGVELAAELERAAKAAGVYFEGPASPEGPAEADPMPRDAKGRFLPKTTTADTTTTPPATVPQPEASQPEPAPVEPAQPTHPALDPVFVEAVKGMGLSDADLAGATTEDEVLNKLQTRRASKHREALESLGLSDAEYAAIQRVRQSAAEPAPSVAAPPPATQPTPAANPAQAAAEPVLPEFNEDELDPETAKVVKGVLKYVADAKADMAAKLQAFQQGVEEQQRQSAAAAQAAQREAQLDEIWDKVAVQIPGFTEYFGGKPSEIKRIAKTNPGDRRVRDFMYFANDFNDSWGKYQGFGENETTLKLALRDAWRSSALSKVQAAKNGNGSTNGHSNGKSYMPGSVVSGGSNRISPMEPDITDGDLDAEMRRIDAILDKKGGQPFREPKV